MVTPSAAVLGRAFFVRAVDVVAHDLVGCVIVVTAGEATLRARVVETEAYGGADDPASHAYRGATPRSATMFGPAGHLYVYRIYGLHWCVNVVTGPEGDASAVLLRAAQLLAEGNDPGTPSTPLRGPGNLTRALGITGADSGSDCCAGRRSRIYFERDTRTTSDHIVQSTRVGLSKGVDRLSRYFAAGDAAVSGPRPLAPPGFDGAAR